MPLEPVEVPGKGRGYLAEAALSEGEAVLCRYPDLAVLYTQPARTQCASCFQPAANGWSCTECGSFRLCAQCDQPGLRAWHGHECALFLTVPPGMRSGDTDYLRFVLRFVAWLAHGPPPGLPDGSGTGVPGQFSSLCHNREVQTAEFLSWTEQFANLFGAHRLLGEVVTPEQLAELLCKIRANALGFPFSDTEILGWCLEEQASVFNHSCSANCFIECSAAPISQKSDRLAGERGELRVRTKRPVEASEVREVSEQW